MKGTGAGGTAGAGGGTVIGDGMLLGSSNDGESCARVRPPPSSSQGFSSSGADAGSTPGVGFESFLSITAQLG
jgi:hypothetical protein